MPASALACALAVAVSFALPAAAGAEAEVAPATPKSAATQAASGEVRQTPQEPRTPGSLTECRRLALADRLAATDCYRGLLAAPALDIRAEAAWALGDLRVAARAFRAAIEAAPDDADIRVRFADMRFAAHLAADAETGYLEALAIDPAHAGAKLGLARIAMSRFEGRAQELANEVLEAQPDNADARLLLAELALEFGDTPRAEQWLAHGLGHPDERVRLRAMALAAACDHLRGIAPSPWEARALASHPGNGALFETVARFYIITRRYREAVALLERAVATDPALWSAHATLGLNLLRLDRFDDGRAALTRAHNGFPYNPQVVNTLRLLDGMAEWPVRAEADVTLRIAPEESEALGPYVRRLVADAVRVIGARYGFTPSGPVVVELFARHADFAVRTSGLPGIGILGATFGDVVVMDSPSARGVDEGFDWASALWHEVAHVVTLGATDNRVSRWFSEGVSVLEEWQTGPSRFQVPPAPVELGAGADLGPDEPASAGANEPPRGPAVPPSVIKAYRDGRLLPVAKLDEGFIRPSYAGQVGVSYTQAGLLCEHIVATRGHHAVAAVLDEYRAGKDTADAIRGALGVEPETLDAEFADHLAGRFAGIDIAAFDDAMGRARAAYEAQNWPGAAAAAEEAIAAQPYRVDQNSPYPLLAQAENRLGRRDQAIAALTTYWQAGGRGEAALSRLAEWQEAAGRAEDALAARAMLALVSPMSPAHRGVLGDRLFAVGRAADALVEYRAHFALGPHDAATAHYRLAKANHALDHTDLARRHLLAALEVAPRFPEALTLLLEMAK